MKLAGWFCIIVELSFLSCTNSQGSRTRVALYLPTSPGEEVFLSRLPYLDEKKMIIDSAANKRGRDSVVFAVAMEPDRLYEIQIKSTDQTFLFIADAPYIKIEAKNILAKPTIIGSLATLSLRDFNYRQNEIAKNIRRIEVEMDTVVKIHYHKMLMDSLHERLNDSFLLMRERNFRYADTVNSPAAFLAVYSNIDFANNDSGRTQLRGFILRASSRFRNSQSVQRLKQEVFNMLSIFEQEFDVGDSLPSLTLPDVNGKMFSTASLKGKYYLLDLWATWCDRCSLYDRYKKKIKETFSPDKFELVGVALDADKKSWANFVRERNYDWPELID